MKIRVLGAAAGGGFPQWNCNHPNSRRARDGDPAAAPRTQSSITVSADGAHWFLFNASPDLRQQINANSILHPKNSPRHSPIQGVVLTNADVDHVTGLLTLRESQPLVIYATGRVLGVLGANSIFNVLNPELVQRRPITLEQPFELGGPEGYRSGLTVKPFAVPGKVALWLEDATKGPNFGSVEEDTIALEVSGPAGGPRFYYIPGCAEMTSALAERIRGADLIFFDGTLWVDDEMIRDGVGIKTGKRMGHLSVSGEDGTMAALRELGIKRRIFIHINTTNPILLDDSAERKAVNEAGWEVAYDGMAINLD
ncbi:MAG: pyrroloquinoline quinone biosynthesis protein PqqB [Gammaproteobacteria bacterium]|nr:pyrroloquinoline quinone biosynthesis protein PqqB [Gammaproteobacteria bacterium]